MSPLTQNLAMIQRFHPELLRILSQPISTSHLNIIPTKSGPAQLVVTKTDGQTLALHDSHHPLRPIQRMAQQMREHPAGVRVILGFELGYLAKFLCRDLPNRTGLIFYEADPAILFMAIHLVDLTDVLSHPRVVIHVGPHPPLRQSCSTYLKKFGGPLRTNIYGPSFHLAPKVYEEKIHQDLSALSSILESTTRMKEWDGKLLTKNLLENIPRILRCPSSVPLRNKWKHKPAILIAAGPSLQRTVSQLKHAKGHALLIAADTALKFLLHHDVIPDMVVSIDPQPTTSKKYEGVNIPKEVTLLFHPATHYQLVEQFPGHALTMDVSLPAYQWLRQYWESKGSFDQEATCQIQVGFNFAAGLGCEPLVLVGHDFCFSEEGLHVPSVSYLSPSDFEHFRNEAWNVPHSDGRIVKSHPTLWNDKRMLEKKIRDFPGSVINASEGGLDIEGALFFPLSNVLKQFQHQTVPDLYESVHKLYQNPIPWPIWRMQQDIQTRLRDLFRIQRTARHVCRLLEHMQVFLQQSGELTEEFKALGEQVDTLTHFLSQYDQAHTLLYGMNSTMAKQSEQDSLAIAQEPNLSSKIHRHIQSNLRYYREIESLVPSLRQWLFRLSERVTESLQQEERCLD